MLQKVYRTVLISIFFLLTQSFISILNGQICNGEKVLLVESGRDVPEDFSLFFEDQFDGDSLDLSKWHWAHGSLVVSHTQEYFRYENVRVNGGICYVTAKEEKLVAKAILDAGSDSLLKDGKPNLRTFNYTSANLFSVNLFGFGVYEIRCKIPNGMGLWPAFWLYGVDPLNNNQYNEVDVFEFWDNEFDKQHITIHRNNRLCGFNKMGVDFSSDFHVFSLLWNNYKLVWSVDGVPVQTIWKFYSLLGQGLDAHQLQAGQVYVRNNDFPKHDMRIIFSMGIQSGEFAPDASTQLPKHFEVDYIRYYKQ